MKAMSSNIWSITRHVLLGAVIGIIVLHPLTKAVYWFEFKDTMATGVNGLWEFLVLRVETSFSIEMIPMSAIFALIGGGIGFWFALYHLVIVKQHRTVLYLEKELAEDLPLLISGGENEHLEFKSSARWDHQQGKLNRALEGVIAKTITGFMNHKGGSLLVGVSDDGDIIGLTHDYQTLKHKDRDGFERCITDIIKTRLGGNFCALVHCVFYQIDEKDVCRIVVEPSPEPVYCVDGKLPRYFLRTGNGTRELDVREALAHVTRR